MNQFALSSFTIASSDGLRKKSRSFDQCDFQSLLTEPLDTSPLLVDNVRRGARLTTPVGIGGSLQQVNSVVITVVCSAIFFSPAVCHLFQLLLALLTHWFKSFILLFAVLKWVLWLKKGKLNYTMFQCLTVTFS